MIEPDYTMGPAERSAWANGFSAGKQAAFNCCRQLVRSYANLNEDSRTALIEVMNLFEKSAKL